MSLQNIMIRKIFSKGEKSFRLEITARDDVENDEITLTATVIHMCDKMPNQIDLENANAITSNASVAIGQSDGPNVDVAIIVPGLNVEASALTWKAKQKFDQKKANAIILYAICLLGYTPDFSGNIDQGNPIFLHYVQQFVSMYQLTGLFDACMDMAIKLNKMLEDVAISNAKVTR